MEPSKTTIENLQWQVFLITGEKALQQRLGSDPEALEEAMDRVQLSLDLDAIEKWLKWILAFLQFFNNAFLTKKGYKKPGFWRYASVIGALFVLGLQLVGLKKIK